jgi:hypothetical protein
MKRMVMIVSMVCCLVALQSAEAQQAYRFAAGKTYRYELELHNDVTNSAGGDASSLSTGVTALIALRPDKVLPSGTMHCTATIEKARIVTEDANGSQVTGDSLTGKTFGFTLHGDGRIVRDPASRSSRNADLSIQQDIMTVMNGMLQTFHTLDASRLKAGQRWDLSVRDSSLAGGTRIYTGSNNSYEARGMSKAAGRPCLELVFTGTHDAHSAPGASAMRVADNGTQAGSILFDTAEGIPLLSTQKYGSTQFMGAANAPATAPSILLSLNARLEFKP